MKILVTGSSGFIGTHVMKALGEEATAFVGDVRSVEDWRQKNPQPDVVVHLAARVGTGESMYRVKDYTSVNVGGTAAMIEALRGSKLRRVVLASSSALYGDGGTEITEDAPLVPRSVYGLTKLVQEQLLAVSGIPTAALRLFGVYGPGQALDNPYSGIVGLLASSLLNGIDPVLYEDGQQRRDLVYVEDVAEAIAMACRGGDEWVGPTNIGHGSAVSLVDLVKALREELGGPEPRILDQHRAGDIRDSVASITRALRLGWRPRTPTILGLNTFCRWALHERDRARPVQYQAMRELQDREMLK